MSPEETLNAEGYKATDHHNRLMGWGMLGALVYAIYYSIYSEMSVKNLLPYWLFLLTNTISTVLTLAIALGFLGFLLKYQSPFAFQATFVFLIPRIIGLLPFPKNLYIGLGINTVSYTVVAIILWTTRSHVKNPKTLLVLAITMVTLSIGPFFLQYILSPFYTSEQDLVGRAILLGPYWIVRSLFYVLAFSLFDTELT
ncbi:MAG: hypothetical protein ACFFE2_07595 [Candidatus Thorarchaeota archaeon]